MLNAELQLSVNYQCHFLQKYFYVVKNKQNVILLHHRIYIAFLHCNLIVIVTFCCDNNTDPPCLQKGQDDVWPESEEEEKESQPRLGLSKQGSSG